ncbi:putative pentatricopeptide repeat domain-containing protein [Botrytis fragariae]|uniref:Putative pentatricopeptide repeat domain-containing protein n=1 Tax=Botrytis fragariae TaxID=1964551 RepID=A0A8H6B0I9_9HELO|nr:putative pentatricopeptide repeat domain-containing protein [Botrytis fragariae]KAF5877166.1 putative pentatricopeptide repeat domain-containing protein [Botrytis fragariae]
MGPFLRGFATRKSTIATSLHMPPSTKSDRKYNGRRWLYKSTGPRNSPSTFVRKESGNEEATNLEQFEEGDEIINDGSQAAKQAYWRRYEIRNKHRNVKTFFKTPEWMKPPWSKEENLKDWWVGKHATEKSQSQEAYGDIYPLEIPTPGEQDEVSDGSDLVSVIRKVGVGLPVNQAQRRILLKEAKMVSEYKSVLRALQFRDPHELLKVLVKLSKVDNFGVNYSPLLDIPPNTFSEILRLLDPKHFFGRYKALLQDFKHKDLLEMRTDTVDYDGTHRAYTVYLWHLRRIIMKRQIKYPIHLSEYKMLLKAAKFTGHQEVAELTWKSLISNQFQVMENRKILPDVECFNYYMATMCWSDVLSPYHSERLRVVSHHKDLRQWDNRPYQLNRHRIGSNNGVRLSVNKLFQEMGKAGLMGNEETFCLLMISASREGDLETAKTILKRVWSIDIELKNGENSKLNTRLPDSPLYPSRRLLRTIIHMFCINNDLPMAIHVMDQVSRKYSIDIPKRAWQDLLEWTAVFARRRGSAAQRELGFDEGVLPSSSMNEVWNNMILHYNVEPNLSMYNIYIRHLLYNRQIGTAQIQIARARQLHNRLAKIVDRYRILYESSLKRRKPDSAITQIRQRDFTFYRFKLRVSRMYMRQWVNYLIYRPAEYLSKDHANWAFQKVPDIVNNYKTFLRGELTYQTYTGHIRLDTGKSEDTKLRIWRRVYGDTRSKKRRQRKSLARLLNRKNEYRYNRDRQAVGGPVQLAAKVVQDHRFKN